MFYCVVPRELEGQLLDRLRDHYAGDSEIDVIVDRRRGERRQSRTYRPAVEKRVIRDRRRRRVCGELPALEPQTPPDPA
jgi:hypothetical protein